MEESSARNHKAPSASSTIVWIYALSIAIFDHLSYFYYGVISRLLALIGLEKRRHVSVCASSRSRDSAILITGSSSGIGQFLALDWFSKGYTVFATVRKAEDGQYLEDIASNIAQESGRLTGQLIPIIVDLADPLSLENGLQAIQENVDRLGLGLVAIVNNAAEFTFGVTESLSNTEIERAIQINLLSPLSITKRLFSLLKETRGRVINIGSPNAWLPSPGLSVYSITKASLRAWSLSLSIEGRLWGISVSLIEPGITHTNASYKFMQALDSLANTTTMDERSHQRYMPMIKYYREAVAKRSGLSIHPVHVGRAVSHALLSPYPKRVYYVGWNSRIIASISWLIGDENICRMLETVTKMKE